MRLRVLALAALWLAATSLAWVGGGLTLPLLGAGIGTLGYWAGWRWRNQKSLVKSLVIASLVIALSIYMRPQMLEVLNGNWMPVGQFLILLQAFFSFDSRSRGGLYSGMALSGSVLFFASQQAFEPSFGLFIMGFIVVLLAFLTLSFLEDSIRGVKVRHKLGRPAMLPYWVGISCAVIMLSGLAFWLMPKGALNLVGLAQLTVLPYSGESLDPDYRPPEIDPSQLISIPDPQAPDLPENTSNPIESETADAATVDQNPLPQAETASTAPSTPVANHEFSTATGSKEFTGPGASNSQAVDLPENTSNPIEGETAVAAPVDQNPLPQAETASAVPSTPVGSPEVTSTTGSKDSTVGGATNSQAADLPENTSNPIEGETAVAAPVDQNPLPQAETASAVPSAAVGSHEVSTATGSKELTGPGATNSQAADLPENTSNPIEDRTTVAAPVDQNPLPQAETASAVPSAPVGSPEVTSTTGSKDSTVGGATNSQAADLPENTSNSTEGETAVAAPVDQYPMPQAETASPVPSALVGSPEVSITPGNKVPTGSSESNPQATDLPENTSNSIEGETAVAAPVDQSPVPQAETASPVSTALVGSPEVSITPGNKVPTGSSESNPQAAEVPENTSNPATDGITVPAPIEQSPLPQAETGSSVPSTLNGNPETINTLGGKEPTGPSESNSRAWTGNEPVFYVRTKVTSYWRGRTFQEFDGQSWRSETAWDLVPSRTRDGIWINQANLNWDRQALYQQTFYIREDSPDATFAGYSALSVEDLNGDLDGVGVASGATYRVVSAYPAHNPESLRQDSSRVANGRFMQVPSEFGTWLFPLADQITSGAGSDFEKAERIVSYLRREGSAFLPDWPEETAGTARLEEFLADGQPGNAMDYATATVMLARVSGLPSRLAVGYLPGSRDPLSGAYRVKRSDAHAWAEIYFANGEWIPFDSSPRGDLAAGGTAATNVGFLFQPGVGDAAFDAVKSVPSQVVSTLFEALNNAALLIIGPSIFLAVLVLRWFYFRQTKERTKSSVARRYQGRLPGKDRRELLALYRKLEKLLQRMSGQRRKPWETVGGYAGQTGPLDPQTRSELAWFTGAIWRAAYDPEELPKGIVAEAKHRLRQLRESLKAAGKPVPRRQV